MLNTIASVLIFVSTVLPGLAGEYIHRVLRGANWDNDQFTRIIYLLFFSVSGAVGYTYVAYALGLPLPSYVFPNAFDNFTPQDLEAWGLAYLGHWLGSLAVGILTCVFLS